MSVKWRNSFLILQGLCIVVLVPNKLQVLWREKAMKSALFMKPTNKGSKNPFNPMSGSFRINDNNTSTRLKQQTSRNQRWDLWFLSDGETSPPPLLEEWGELKSRMGTRFKRENDGRGTTVHLASRSPVLIIPFHNRCPTRVSWESLDCKKIQPVSPEYSLEGLMLKLKLQYFGYLMQRADSLEKTLMLGKIEGKKRRVQQRMR